MESTKTLLLLFLVLGLAMRFPEASADSNSVEEILSEPAEEALSADRRGLPHCSDTFSKGFCRRFRHFCAATNSNGFLMRTKCDFSCGCMR
ncbi:hypothetical protein ACROYT_G009201 [Oculina patagonica]